MSAKEEFNLQLFKLQSLFEQEISKSSNLESRFKAVLEKEEGMAKYKQDTATQLQELLNTFAEQEKHIDMLQAKENSRKEEVKTLENKLRATVIKKEKLEEKLAIKEKQIGGINVLIKDHKQTQNNGLNLNEYDPKDALTLDIKAESTQEYHTMDDMDVDESENESEDEVEDFKETETSTNTHGLIKACEIDRHKTDTLVETDDLSEIQDLVTFSDSEDEEHFDAQNYDKMQEERKQSELTEDTKRFENKEKDLKHKKGFKCEVLDCNKSYINLSGLAYHKEHYNHDIHDIIGTNGKVLKYKCEEADCNKMFSCTSGLTYHKKRHLNFKPFKCNYCGKDFLQKSNMKSHIKKIHTKQSDGTEET